MIDQNVEIDKFQKQQIIDGIEELSQNLGLTKYRVAQALLAMFGPDALPRDIHFVDGCAHQLDHEKWEEVLPSKGVVIQGYIDGPQ